MTEVLEILLLYILYMVILFIPRLYNDPSLSNCAEILGNCYGYGRSKKMINK